MQVKELYQSYLECGQTICTDTRAIIDNSLFFALKGTNFDGNEYAQQALQEGAKFAVIDNPKFQGENTILVEDVLTALQQLANHHRKQFDIPVIGITGSNGKTTTKELVAAILTKKYNTLVTEGNLNNHLGVPFTLLRLRKEHEIAIIEMGANKIHDIQELCEIAEPNYGLITNIGKAHIEGFKTYENVILTKTELYESVEMEGGTVFINADDQVLMRNAPACDLITYGDKGQLKGKITKLDPYLSFVWNAGEDSREIKTQMVGSYNLYNYIAAACLGMFFNVEPESISNALENYTPNNHRSQLTKIGDTNVIMDCYNANPTSMMGALENFKLMDVDHKLAIIGDMRELGEISKEEHQKVVDWLLKNKIEAILVGEEFSEVSNSLTSFKDVNELMQDYEKEGVRKYKNILLKGSRGIKLEELVSQKFIS